MSTAIGEFFFERVSTESNVFVSFSFPCPRVALCASRVISAFRLRGKLLSRIEKRLSLLERFRNVEFSARFEHRYDGDIAHISVAEIFGEILPRYMGF